MTEPLLQLNSAPLRGYIEGYFGRLLGWSDRLAILDTLQVNEQGVYWYAPKEDPWHRFAWREPPSDAWQAEFVRFCSQAGERGVDIIAGMAPGLNFDFSQAADGPDFQRLVAKNRALQNAGATRLSLLLDDIDPESHQRTGDTRSEGHAHAELANRLGEALGCPLLVVPRAYASDLAEASPGYLPDFLATLDRHHTLVHTGAFIVSRQLCRDDIRQHAPGFGGDVVYWDNLYANDYCPRRLFTGPWSGRDPELSILLNPTGLVCTDRLLLDLVASADRVPGGHDDAGAGSGASAATSATSELAGGSAWWACLASHGVPEAFLSVAPWFCHPVFNDASLNDASMVVVPAPRTEHLQALDELLWSWKGALSREWYPYLLALKQDLQLAMGLQSNRRIAKSHSATLAGLLTGSLAGQKAY